MLHASIKQSAPGGPEKFQGSVYENGIRCSSKWSVCDGVLSGGNRLEQKSNVPSMSEVPCADDLDGRAACPGQQNKESCLTESHALQARSRTAQSFSRRIQLSGKKNARS